MKNEYNQFKQAMNKTADDIVKKYGQNLSLAYSGGVDATAILLSLLNADANVTLLHRRRPLDKIEEGWEDFYEDSVAYYIADKLDLPTIFLPHSGLEGLFLYDYIAKMGFNKIVSGEGMDDIYGVLFFNRTFGEGIWAKYPLIDLFKSVPSGVRMYSKKNQRRVSDTHKRREEEEKNLFKRVKKKYNAEVILFSHQQALLDFFSNYKSSAKDIVFPKLLTKKYADEYMKKYVRKSYRDMCKKAYNLNRLKYPSSYRRVFKYLDDGTLFEKLLNE